MSRLAEDVNLPGRFLGVRDVPELTQAVLKRRFGFERAVLFGGSIIAHVDVPADVNAAFLRLKQRFGVRKADERYR